jgi:hypothetical protein
VHASVTGNCWKGQLQIREIAFERWALNLRHRRFDPSFFFCVFLLCQPCPGRVVDRTDCVLTLRDASAEKQLLKLLNLSSRILLSLRGFVASRNV